MYYKYINILLIYFLSLFLSFREKCYCKNKFNCHDFRTAFNFIACGCLYFLGHIYIESFCHNFAIRNVSSCFFTFLGGFVLKEKKSRFFFCKKTERKTCI